MAKKYYVVWKGRQTGIFDNWPDCEKAIKGFPNAKYRSFRTLAAAQAAFKKSYEDYQKQKVKLQDLFSPKPIVESIAVDAAYSSKTGKTEYQGVYVKTGERLFYKSFPSGTNNLAEFLAIVHALAFLKQKNINMPVYSDSATAIKWVQQKNVSTSLPRNDKNKDIFQLLDKAITWLKNNDISEFQILKWHTDIWGEIPADFGNKN